MKTQSSTVRNIGRWLVRLVLLATVLFFIGRYVHTNWAAISGKAWHVEWGYVAFAIACAWVSFLLMIELWRKSLLVCGSKVNYRLAWNTWYRTLLAKYVPGKVWAVLGLVYFAKQKGVPVEKSAAAAALWQSMAFPGLSFVFLITIPFWRILPPQYMIIVAIVIIALMALVLHPRIFYPLLNLALKKLKKPEIHVRFKYTQLLYLIFISVVITLIQGIAFVSFARSLTLLSAYEIPLLIGSFSLSLLLGLISFFAPAGIGVREGILLALLSRDFSPDIAIMIGIGARLWWTFAEVSFTGISVFAAKSAGSYDAVHDIGQDYNQGNSSKDFTHDAYARYLSAIKSSYPNILRFDEYMSMNPKPETFCILRHDVDRRPNMALKMAKLEHKIGVRSTYYFRTKGHCFKPAVIREIASLGHEIGYHYESLSDTQGDMDRALDNFAENFGKLSEVVPVKTISAHGRPLKRYNNLDLWLYSGNHGLLSKRFSALGCANLDIDYRGIVYIHDTGRNWFSNKANIRDYAPNSISLDFKNGEELYEFFKSQSYKKVVFQVHPERWADNRYNYYYSVLFDSLANLAKKIIIKYRSSRLFQRLRR